MGHLIRRRGHTCSLVILLLPLAVSTAKADINNPIFSQPDNGMYGFTSLSQKWPPFNVNSEAAEFDVSGQVRTYRDGRRDIWSNHAIQACNREIPRGVQADWTRYRQNSNDEVYTAPFRSVCRTRDPRRVISTATAARTRTSFARRTAHGTR